MSKALVHIPELLAFVHAGEKEVAAEVADAEAHPTSGGGEDDFDWDGGDEGDEEGGDDVGDGGECSIAKGMLLADSRCSRNHGHAAC